MMELYFQEEMDKLNKENSELKEQNKELKQEIAKIKEAVKKTTGQEIDQLINLQVNTLL